MDKILSNIMNKKKKTPRKEAPLAQIPQKKKRGIGLTLR